MGALKSFSEWARQSGASMMGSGIMGRGAYTSALKTDRALRNIGTDVWSKVAAEIDSDARQGRYFGCYAVPRSAMSNTGRWIGGNLSDGLYRRGYFALWNKTPQAGEQLFCDVAVFWGHRSRKLFTTPALKMYAFNIFVVYLAECVAHGLDDAIYNSRSGKLMADMGFLGYGEGGTQWYASNFIKMIALYLYKEDTPTIMKFHSPRVHSPREIAEYACDITHTFMKNIEDAVVQSDIDDDQYKLNDKNSIANELIKYKSQYQGGGSQNDMYVDAIRTVGGLVTGRL